MRHRNRMRPLATEQELKADIRREKAAIRRQLPKVGRLPKIDPIEEPAKITPPRVKSTHK